MPRGLSGLSSQRKSLVFSTAVSPKMAQRDRGRIFFGNAEFDAEKRGRTCARSRGLMPRGLSGLSSQRKSLVKIGEPSHTRRFASERGEFSPNRAQFGYSARVV